MRYQSRKLVGTLDGFSNPAGLCADTAGDVWITNEGEHDVIEYAHGGTQPIQTLDDGSEQPSACSVDKKTGNLAVLNADDVAVYPDASGSPTLYSGGQVYGDYALGYGAHGDHHRCVSDDADCVRRPRRRHDSHGERAKCDLFPPSNL